MLAVKCKRGKIDYCRWQQRSEKRVLIGWAAEVLKNKHHLSLCSWIYFLHSGMKSMRVGQAFSSLFLCIRSPQRENAAYLVSPSLCGRIAQSVRDEDGSINSWALTSGNLLANYPSSWKSEKAKEWEGGWFQAWAKWKRKTRERCQRIRIRVVRSQSCSGVNTSGFVCSFSWHKVQVWIQESGQNSESLMHKSRRNRTQRRTTLKEGSEQPAWPTKGSTPLRLSLPLCLKPEEKSEKQSINIFCN